MEFTIRSSGSQFDRRRAHPAQNEKYPPLGQKPTATIGNCGLFGQNENVWSRGPPNVH
jgi:hypothetical protein